MNTEYLKSVERRDAIPFLTQVVQNILNCFLIE